MQIRGGVFVGYYGNITWRNIKRKILSNLCSGGADLISIAPTYIGHSSPCEIKTYQALANSNGGNLGGEFPNDLIDSFSSDDSVSSSEVLEWSSLEFAPTYPCKPVYTTITLHNFR